MVFDSKRTYLPQRDYLFDYSQHLLLVKVHQDGSADACLAVWGMLCAVSEWSCGQLRRKHSSDNNSRSSSGDDDRYHSHVDNISLVLIERHPMNNTSQAGSQNGWFLIRI